MAEIFVVFRLDTVYKPFLFIFQPLFAMVAPSPFHIVLVEPEIPPNTGSIARLCGATNSTLHLIHPLGFATDDRHLKRAGLDYWHQVKIEHWPDLESFLRSRREEELFFFTTKVPRPYTSARFPPQAALIFGCETRGLPEDILRLYEERCYTLPMANPHIRSLNLAMTAGIVLYEALRQHLPGHPGKGETVPVPGRGSGTASTASPP